MVHPDGLSVEQVKRVTIGVEMAANPAVLFLGRRPPFLSGRPCVPFLLHICIAATGLKSSTSWYIACKHMGVVRPSYATGSG